MHKTHIFDQKNNAKKKNYRPSYPIFFGPLQETNIFFRPYQGNEKDGTTLVVWVHSHKMLEKILL